jgi:uncharacterized repeat protein (TIGR03803 family)
MATSVNCRGWIWLTVLAFLLASVVFPSQSQAQKFKVLHTFEDRPAAYPFSRLVADATGNLYGTTQEDNANGGTVYELSPLSDGRWAYQVLHVFKTDGWDPFGRPVLDTAGNLYGTTNDQKVYELTPGSDGHWVAKTLYQLDGWSGEGLAIDAQGNLYGRTYSGYPVCGKLFELTPNSGGQWTETVLHNFSDGECGLGTSLIFDATGDRLYGASDYLVFVLTRNSGGGWDYGIAHRFNQNDGYASSGELIFDATGNLYGTNAAGGRRGGGTAYKLTPQSGGGWISTVLHSFSENSNDDGYGPFGGLTLDSTGNLYGTTSQGGVYGDGVVFKLTPDANGQWVERLLHSFSGGRDGAHPYADLIQDASGNLYGAAKWGGTGQSCQGGCGVVFKIAP